MSINALSLLKQLASGVQPAGTCSSSAGASPIEQTSFADLLAQAQQGSMVSGVSVQVAAGVDVTLTPDQLKLITAAADKAEAAGVQNAMVLIGTPPQRLMLDVRSRQITGQVKPIDGTAGGLVAGIDGVIDLTDSSTTSQPASSIPLPSSLASNPSLNAILQQLGKTA